MKETKQQIIAALLKQSLGVAPNSSQSIVFSLFFCLARTAINKALTSRLCLDAEWSTGLLFSPPSKVYCTLPMARDDNPLSLLCQPVQHHTWNAATAKRHSKKSLLLLSRPARSRVTLLPPAKRVRSSVQTAFPLLCSQLKENWSC